MSVSVEVENRDYNSEASEECDWDSVSESDGQIAKLALGVDPLEVGAFDGSSSPVNGSQYLLSVMMETKKAPKVVVADLSRIEKLKTAKHDKISSQRYAIIQDTKTEDTLAPIFVPNSEWLGSIISNFSMQRSKIDGKRSLITIGEIQIEDNWNMPTKGNIILWFKYCFGARIANRLKKGLINFNSCTQSDFENVLKYFTPDCSENNCDEELTDQISDTENQDNTEERLNDENIIQKEGYRPLVSLMLNLPQRVIEFLISCHFEWFKKYGLFNVRQGEWIYALLACVQKPLEPTTVSDIRGICKCCITLRNRFCLLKSDGTKTEDESTQECPGYNELTDNEREYLTTLDLFIYLIANYFGQTDLLPQD